MGPINLISSGNIINGMFKVHNYILLELCRKTHSTINNYYSKSFFFIIELQNFRNVSYIASVWDRIYK